MIKTRKSYNEHGFASDMFFKLASPHRWSAVRDFMSDNNPTIDFSVRLGDGFPQMVGSCGPAPDRALMEKETGEGSGFDSVADKHGWDCATRRIEFDILQRLKSVHRLQWLEDQINESIKTGSAPLQQMSSKEQSVFLKRIEERKESTRRWREYAQRRGYS